MEPTSDGNCARSPSVIDRVACAAGEHVWVASGRVSKYVRACWYCGRGEIAEDSFGFPSRWHAIDEAPFGDIPDEWNAAYVLAHATHWWTGGEDGWMRFDEAAPPWRRRSDEPRRHEADTADR